MIPFRSIGTFTMRLKRSQREIPGQFQGEKLGPRRTSCLGEVFEPGPFQCLFTVKDNFKYFKYTLRSSLMM